VIKFVSDLWQVGYSGDVYSIQHYVIKFVSDLWQVGYSGLLHQEFEDNKGM
jgi:hypothetical protein